MANDPTPYLGLTAWETAREVIDARFKLAEHHRHTGSVSSVETPDEPELEVGESGGSFVGGQRLYYAVSLVDADGVESSASDPVFIDLPGVVAPPGLSPLIEAFPTGGSLLSGFHKYVFTAYTDGDPNRETSPSDPVFVNVEANGTGRVSVTYPTLPAGANGWNIYRHAPMAVDYLRIRSISAAAAATAGNVFVDDGSYPEDVNRRLPTTNNTSASNSVVVTYPEALPLGGTWKVYRTSVNGDWASTLIAHVTAALSPGSPYTTAEFIDVGYEPMAGSPLNETTDFQNPDPVDLATETTGVIPWSRVANASVPTTQAVDGTVDLSHLPRANAYHCAVDAGTLRFLLPPPGQERQFNLYLNPDTALPESPTWWTVDDPNLATPTVTAASIVWYTANPFTAEVTATVAIMVQVVETAAGTWHYGLSWLNGAGVTAGTGDLDNYARLDAANTFTEPQTVELSVPLTDLDAPGDPLEILKSVLTLIIPEVGTHRIADLFAARVQVAPGFVSNIVGLRAKEYTGTGDATGDDLLFAPSYTAFGLAGFRAFKAPGGNIISSIGYNLIAARVAVAAYTSWSDWASADTPTPEDVPNRAVLDALQASLEQYVDTATTQVPASSVAYNNILVAAQPAVLNGTTPDNDFTGGNIASFGLVINGASYGNIGAAAFTNFTYSGDHATNGVDRLQAAIDATVAEGDEVTVSFTGGHYRFTTVATGPAATIVVFDQEGTSDTGFADGDAAAGPAAVLRYPSLGAVTDVQAVLDLVEATIGPIP